MQLFGNLDILSIVGISRLNWIGYVNRMDSKSQVFNYNPQGNRLRRRPKNRWWNCLQTDTKNAKLKTRKRGQRTELTGRGSLRTRGTVVPSKEEEEEEDEKEEEEGEVCN